MDSLVERLRSGNASEQEAAREIQRLWSVLDGIAHTFTDDADELRNMAAGAIYVLVDDKDETR